MRTFSIQTLGCKVNQYESEQIASVLRSRGMVESKSASTDLRIINTCSVTLSAASKSRYESRKAVRLPVVQPALATGSDDVSSRDTDTLINGSKASRVIVTGCWATSDRAEVERLPGVDAVITHHEDVSRRLNEVLDSWKAMASDESNRPDPSPNPFPMTSGGNGYREGTNSLPILGEHQTGRQRAFLKIQDGCDAHCTYCIIPSLRPRLWSKPVPTVIEEARHLVASGHVELVLTGIFLGAFGQPTALRRRQPHNSAQPIGELIEALCTQVPGLRRLRLSSLEPGDLDSELIGIFKRHPQVVPHFHLPLQSGSDLLLRRMNRQYTQSDYLRLLDQIQQTFELPAITTDIIVGFPGETDAEFAKSIEVARKAKFIHIHAFPFSPRPGTAAARWVDDFIHGPVLNERIQRLQELSSEYSYEFRRHFVAREVELLVEREKGETNGLRHGRCERYFDVHFDSRTAKEGDFIRVKIDRVTATRTHGSYLGPA